MNSKSKALLLVLAAAPATATANFLDDFITAWAGNLPTACASPLAPSIYDRRIYQAAQHYWAPERRSRWCLLKSQMWAESDFRPDAVSPVGAEGLSQFMPATWREVAERLNITQPATDPGAAIKAQGYYMEALASKWSSPRSEACRLRLASASYNAGFGHILSAQRKALMAPCWDRIGPALPQVTGDHAQETRGYVERIDRQYRELTGGEL